MPEEKLNNEYEKCGIFSIGGEFVCAMCAEQEKFNNMKLSGILDGGAALASGLQFAT